MATPMRRSAGAALALLLACAAAGERYVFQVMLEDLEGGALENRSLSFSEPYTVPQ